MGVVIIGVIFILIAGLLMTSEFTGDGNLEREYRTKLDEITIKCKTGKITADQSALLKRDVRRWYAQARPRNYKFSSITFGIACVCGFIGIIMVLYYPWYYLCCGFLVVDCAEGPIETILYFILTLIPAGFFAGLIAICFGWNPGK